MCFFKTILNVTVSSGTRMHSFTSAHRLHVSQRRHRCGPNHCGLCRSAGAWLGCFFQTGAFLLLLLCSVCRMLNESIKEEATWYLRGPLPLLKTPEALIEKQILWELLGAPCQSDSLQTMICSHCFKNWDSRLG